MQREVEVPPRSLLVGMTLGWGWEIHQKCDLTKLIIENCTVSNIQLNLPSAASSRPSMAKQVGAH